MIVPRSVICATAAILTGALHLLLVISIIVGGRQSAVRQPDLKLVGDAPSENSGESAMQWVVLNEVSNGSKSDAEAESFLPNEAINLRNLSIQHQETPTLASSPEAPAVVSATTEAATASQLFGRYMGQIDARIERAWVRPRSDIGAPRFACRARIQQDRYGGVVGVWLEHCNGSPRWQQSLMSAIRTASPLPAPPDPSVYADLLTLSFEAGAYSVGGPEEGFEPVNKTVLLASQERQQFEHFAQRAGTASDPQAKQDAGVVHLTIVGEPSHGLPITTPPDEPNSQTSFRQPEDTVPAN